MRLSAFFQVSTTPGRRHPVMAGSGSATPAISKRILTCRQTTWDESPSGGGGHRAGRRARSGRRASHREPSDAEAWIVVPMYQPRPHRLNPWCRPCGAVCRGIGAPRGSDPLVLSLPARGFNAWVCWESWRASAKQYGIPATRSWTSSATSGAVVDGVGAVAGFIERVGKSAHLDDVIEVGEQLGGWAERVGLNKFLRAADSPILDGGQVVIAGMKLTTGIGEPEHGDRFGRGGARFHDAGTTLRSAQPTASWSGEGADSYAAQNIQQTARTKAIAAVDHEVHRVIAEEAFQVGFHRDHLDDWSNFLADFGLVTFALGLIPGVGQELKAAAELHAVLAAVISSSTELHQMSSEAEANAANLQQLVARYENVAQTANLSPTGADPGPPPPPPPPQPSAPPEQSPTGGPHDQQPGNGPATSPTPTPTPPAPMPAPSGPVRSAPSMPAAGGSGSGGGAGSPIERWTSRSASVDMPAPAEVPTRTASGSTGAPPSSGALPGVSGGITAQPDGGGRSSTGGVRCPVGPHQGRSAGGHAARGREAGRGAWPHGEEGEDDKDNDGEPDSEEDLNEDLDGDGKPDADHEEKAGAHEDTPKKDQPAAAAGGVDGGRAPVHIEMDVDTEQLLTPMTVTVDSYGRVGQPSSAFFWRYPGQRRRRSSDRSPGPSCVEVIRRRGPAGPAPRRSPARPRRPRRR